MRYLYDTNIFLSYLIGEQRVRELFTERFLKKNQVVTSRIVRLELLSFPELSVKEETIMREMLDQFVMVPITEEIENVAIYFRRKYRIKIPDAIIAATATTHLLPL